MLPEAINLIAIQMLRHCYPLLKVKRGESIVNSPSLLCKTSISRIVSHDFVGQMLAPHAIFAAFLIAWTHTLFLAWTEDLSYNCSRYLVCLEGDCDGSIYAYAISR